MSLPKTLEYVKNIIDTHGGLLTDDRSCRLPVEWNDARALDIYRALTARSLFFANVNATPSYVRRHVASRVPCTWTIISERHLIITLDSESALDEARRALAGLNPRDSDTPVFATLCAQIRDTMHPLPPVYDPVPAWLAMFPQAPPYEPLRA